MGFGKALGQTQGNRISNLHIRHSGESRSPETAGLRKPGTKLLISTTGFPLARESRIRSSLNAIRNCSRLRGRKRFTVEIPCLVALHDRPNSPQIPVSLNSYDKIAGIV